MTLRFCHADDLQNVWGHTTIGTSALRKLADCDPPPKVTAHAGKPSRWSDPREEVTR